MAEMRTTCLRCPTYDRDAGRCRVGKTNPRKKHEAQTVAELLGVRALCLHNPFREPLILRMRFAKRRFIWDENRRPLLSQPIEIEILENSEENNDA